MAGNNEIDASLVALLNQNIASARAAGQEQARRLGLRPSHAAPVLVCVLGPWGIGTRLASRQAAAFMEKLLVAVSKFVIAPSSPPPAMPEETSTTIDVSPTPAAATKGPLSAGSASTLLGLETTESAEAARARRRRANAN